MFAKCANYSESKRALERFIMLRWLSRKAKLKNSENIGQISKLKNLGEIREYHNKRKENNTTLKYISRYNSEKKVTQFNLHFGTLVKINASM